MLEIAFDIETIANADMVDHLPEPALTLSIYNRISGILI